MAGVKFYLRTEFVHRARVYLLYCYTRGSYWSQSDCRVVIRRGLSYIYIYIILCSVTPQHTHARTIFYQVRITAESELAIQQIWSNWAQWSRPIRPPLLLLRIIRNSSHNIASFSPPPQTVPRVHCPVHCTLSSAVFPGNIIWCPPITHPPRRCRTIIITAVVVVVITGQNCITSRS